MYYFLGALDILTRSTLARNGVAAWRRGASTTFVAGDKRSIPHNIFCGVTAPLAPNRSLSAGILSVLSSRFVLFPIFRVNGL
jgi:hypothetical protein